MSEQWFMSPFRHLLHDHRLWGVRRRTVVPAFAIGLFIAFMPFPGHTLTAALLALAFRVNIPVAALATWVSNPITMFAMYPAAFHLGSTLLGMPERDIGFEMSWDWVSNTFVNIWQPMSLGCVIMGATASILGYFVLDFFWRSSIADYKSRKQTIRRNQKG